MYCKCIRINVVKYNPDKCEHVCSLLAHNCLGKNGELLTYHGRRDTTLSSSQKTDIKPPTGPFCSIQTSLLHGGEGNRWEQEDISCCPLVRSPCSPLSQGHSRVIMSTFSGHVLEVWGHAPSPPALPMN